MARPVGSREISVETIDKIVEMTLSKEHSRPEIARTAGVSIDTVWRYQKNLGLV